VYIEKSKNKGEKMKIIRRIFALAFAIFFFTSCTPAIKSTKGWPIPDIKQGYKVVSKEYGKMKEESIPKCFRDMYKVAKLGGYCPGQFNDDSTVYVVILEKKKGGEKVIKFYHKTQPFAYTIKKGEEIYTLVNTKCIEGVYDAKIPGILKYEKYEEKNSKDIRLNTPEPDDFNPYTDDLSPENDPDYFKACEWHKKTY
jgi:hypothetical protein